MPKIEVDYQEFSSLYGSKASMEDLERIFPAAKAELDEALNAEGIMKVELNDTNRPDLWSTAGLARCLKTYQAGKGPQWNFFSSASKKQSPKAVLKVDPSTQKVRPFIAAFLAESAGVSDAGLKSLIQSQEKLCWNFGQKRKSIAMGIYRADLISFPVHYKGVDPEKTRFVPLGLDAELNLNEILKQHPKGQEYGHILANQDVFPLLQDDKNKVLSFPPIINSNDLGAVKIGDKKLFVELTGTDLPSLLLACSIMACDMADSGFTISPVQVDYPEATVYGSAIVCPYYFQEKVQTNLGDVNRLLGEKLDVKAVEEALIRMGNAVEVQGETFVVQPAEYRNDFLHPVDLIEDVMIGRGMDSFKPELPRAFTVGRLTPMEEFSRRIKSLMVGMGYQEMIFNYLGSAKDYVWKMNPQMSELLKTLEPDADPASVFVDEKLVQIMNPMSENFAVVRNSILPSLLGAEASSANALYPHLIFEVGKVARRDAEENYGSRTDTDLGFLAALNSADFNFINSQVQALMYYISAEYTLAESSDPRFIPGRRADVMVKGKKVASFGEVHPGILENWGITVPCAAGEFTLNFLR